MSGAPQSPPRSPSMHTKIQSTVTVKKMQMGLHQTQILGIHHIPRRYPDGPYQDSSNYRVPLAQDIKKSPKFPRSHKLLLTIPTKLSIYYCPTPPTTAEKHGVHMVSQMARKFSTTEGFSKKRQKYLLTQILHNRSAYNGRIQHESVQCYSNKMRHCNDARSHS